METRRPYAQRARAERAAATHEAVIAAVIALFAETGQTPTLQAVATRAGVTVQTVLRRFGSKQGLQAAVVARAGAEVEAQRMAAPVGDVAGAIDNLLDHYAAWGEVALRMLALESEAGGAGPGSASEGRGLHRRWVEHVFAPALDPLPGPARAMRVDQLAAVTDVYVWKILVRDLGRSRAAAHATLVDLVRRLLGVEEG